MKVRSFFLIIIFFGITQVFAHGGLEDMPAADLTRIQKDLVEKGYLNLASGTKYGVYDLYTELAYDAHDKDRIKKKLETERVEREKKRLLEEENKKVADELAYGSMNAINRIYHVTMAWLTSLFKR